MSDVKNIVTLGIGAAPGKLEWFITTGLESAVELDTSVTISLIVKQDDLSVTVPAEKTVYTTWYGEVFLVDESGNFLVDESGNFLTIKVATTENVYVVNVPPDDLSIVIPEET